MTMFTQWLKDQDSKNELEKFLVPETNKLDQLYWHRILKCTGLEFPDGIYFVTACLEEDDGFVFGLFPLEVSGEYVWITYRSKDLNWLNKTEIIDTDKYNHVIDKFNVAADVLTRNLPNE